MNHAKGDDIEVHTLKGENKSNQEIWIIINYMLSVKAFH